MAFEVREIQATPNPNALKFILDQTISNRPMSFLSSASAVDHPLARKLFLIEGVTGVLLLSNFVTINKNPEVKWPEIKRNVKKTLKNA